MEMKSLVFKRGTEVYVPADLICRYHGDSTTLVGKIDSYEKNRVRVIIPGLNGAFPVPRDKVWPVYKSDLIRAQEREIKMEKQRELLLKEKLRKKARKKKINKEIIVTKCYGSATTKREIPSSVSQAMAHPYSGGMVRPR